MNLSLLLSDRLLAFVKVSELGSFTEAADKLFISQPALSKRIQLLEEGLGARLFLRGLSGVALTAEGETLLQFAKQAQNLGREALDSLSPKSQPNLKGVVRIGGLSSQVYSLIFPIIGPFVQRHPEVQLDFRIREAKDLPRILSRQEIDFALSDSNLKRRGIFTIPVGSEKMVVIRNKHNDKRQDVYLDVSENDEVTKKFFANQAKKIHFSRDYVHSTEGILQGVKAGLGRAVIEERLIDGSVDKYVEVVPGFRPLYIPFYLHYVGQTIYTKLQIATRELLLAELPKHLVTT